MLVCIKVLLLNQYLSSKDPTKDDSKGTTWTLSQCLEPSCSLSEPSEPRITFQSIQSNTGSCLGPRYKAKIFFPEVCSQHSIGRVSREPTFSLSLALYLSLSWQLTDWKLHPEPGYSTRLPSNGQTKWSSYKSIFCRRFTPRVLPCQLPWLLRVIFLCHHAFKSPLQSVLHWIFNATMSILF